MDLTTSNRTTHYYWLDLLRFLAAFLVLICHSRGDFFVPYGELEASQQGQMPFAFYTITRLGHEAVIIFFVLSGFLVGGAGIKRMQENRFKARSYVVDRSVRIMLPLIASILFYALVCLIISRPFDWICAFGNLFSLQGIFVDSLVSPFWSLSYEVWFYVILFAIALMLRENQGKRWIGLSMLFVCVLIFSCKLKPHYLLIWFMGAFFYLTKPKKFSAVICWGSLLLFVASIALWQMSSASHSVQTEFKANSTELVEVLMSIFFGLFIQQVILLEPKRKWTKAIDRWGTKLAAFSYTLYLSHRIVFLPVYHFITNKRSAYLDIAGISGWLLLVFSTLFVCWLLYLAFEKNTAQVKKYVKTKFNII